MTDQPEPAVDPADYLTVPTRVWVIPIDGYERIQIADTEPDARALAEDAYRRANGIEARAGRPRRATRQEIDAWCDAVDLALDEPNLRQPTADEVALRERLRTVQTGIAALPGPNRVHYERPPEPVGETIRRWRYLWRALAYNTVFGAVSLAPVLAVAIWWPTIPGTTIPDPRPWIWTAPVAAIWFLVAWVAFRPLFDDVIDTDRRRPDPVPTWFLQGSAPDRRTQRRRNR